MSRDRFLRYVEVLSDQDEVSQARQEKKKRLLSGTSFRSDRWSVSAESIDRLVSESDDHSSIDGESDTMMWFDDPLSTTRYSKIY